MADQCPQGYTDVEFPTDTLRAMVERGHATWDSEDGVHKLTPAGQAHLNGYLRPAA